MAFKSLKTTLPKCVGLGVLHQGITQTASTGWGTGYRHDALRRGNIPRHGIQGEVASGCNLNRSSFLEPHTSVKTSGETKRESSGADGFPGVVDFNDGSALLGSPSSTASALPAECFNLAVGTHITATYHNGVVPAATAQLLSLPGVTAAEAEWFNRDG